MNFEFLIRCHMTGDFNIQVVLTDLLGETLQKNLNEFDADAIDQMIVLRHHRQGNEHPDDNGNTFRHELVTFRLELPDETESAPTVMEEFADALQETPPVVHVVRFDDPLLQAELLERAKEIYALEMKLRRVLTIVYLHANQASDPYDLLSNESVQPMAKEKPTPKQMQVAADNQFFHLTFGQYVGLNQRPEIKLPALIEIVRTAEQYETFRAEVLRSPVEQEDDAGLLAGLRERMDAIEKMRNCVAHNRRPSKNVRENYDNARPLLDQLLDDYLAKWAYI